MSAGIETPFMLATICFLEDRDLNSYLSKLCHLSPNEQSKSQNILISYIQSDQESFSRFIAMKWLINYVNLTTDSAGVIENMMIPLAEECDRAEAIIQTLLSKLAQSKVPEATSNLTKSFLKTWAADSAHTLLVLNKIAANLSSSDYLIKAGGYALDILISAIEDNDQHPEHIKEVVRIANIYFHEDIKKSSKFKNALIKVINNKSLSKEFRTDMMNWIYAIKISFTTKELEGLLIGYETICTEASLKLAAKLRELHKLPPRVTPDTEIAKLEALAENVFLAAEGQGRENILNLKDAGPQPPSLIRID